MVYILLAILTTAAFAALSYIGTVSLWLALDKAFGV